MRTFAISKLLCGAMLAAMLWSTPAGAEQAETVLASARLDEVVVTATKIQEPVRDIPASVQVITQEEIKTSTAKDAGDLIVEAGLGHVHKYSGALTSKIEIRGFTTDMFNETKSRVMILINGNRAGTVNLAKIPVDDIERIEIVKGPASVLYGSSAMGGVINIITKRGKDGFENSVGVEGGSWDFRKTNADIGGKKGAFDYYLFAGLSASGDYNAPDYGTVKNSSYKSEAVSTRAGYDCNFPPNRGNAIGYIKSNSFTSGMLFNQYVASEPGNRECLK